MSKFRILKRQNHQLFKLYRVLPLRRQQFKRENQTYVSSHVKSALKKFREESKDRDCDILMSDVSVLYKSCVAYLDKWTTLFVEFQCFD